MIGEPMAALIETESGPPGGDLINTRARPASPGQFADERVTRTLLIVQVGEGRLARHQHEFRRACWRPTVALLQ